MQKGQRNDEHLQAWQGVLVHFTFNGEPVQESTKQGNPRVARQMEAAHETALAKGEVDIRERKPIPLLKDFAQRFIEAIEIRCAERPRDCFLCGEVAAAA